MGWPSKPPPGGLLALQESARERLIGRRGSRQSGGRSNRLFDRHRPAPSAARGESEVGRGGRPSE